MVVAIIQMMDQYFPGLMMVIENNRSPAEAIQQIEK